MFLINAHRALKALLFPATKTALIQYLIRFSALLSWAATQLRHLGKYCKEDCKKKKRNTMSDWSNRSQTHKILGHLDSSGVDSPVGVRRSVPGRSFQYVFGIIQSTRLNDHEPCARTENQPVKRFTVNKRQLEARTTSQTV